MFGDADRIFIRSDWHLLEKQERLYSDFSLPFMYWDI